MAGVNTAWIEEITAGPTCENDWNVAGAIIELRAGRSRPHRKNRELLATILTNFDAKV